MSEKKKEDSNSISESERHDGVASVSTSKPADFISQIIQESNSLSVLSLEGKVVDNRYQVLEKIAEGGMGAVYKAEHLLIKRVIALKVLHPNLADNEESLKRFLYEARIASKLTHPNAVTVYDFGVEKGMPFIAMEYVEGETLRQVIASDGAMSLDKAYFIFSQACLAVSEAHKLGIIHRDLKPDNIMLTVKDDGTIWVRVLDFGIAKLLLPSDQGQSMVLTREGTFVGTPQYMSPEAADNIQDARSDIYSLGIILYEMLSGEVPFKAPSVLQLLMKHAAEPPPSITKRKFSLGISQEIEAVVFKALEKDPNVRYQTVSEMVADLKAAFDKTQSRGLHIFQPSNQIIEKFFTGSKVFITSATILIALFILASIYFFNPVPLGDINESSKVLSGSIRVESQPSQSEVVLDGKTLGLSPLQLNNVSVGEHTLVLRKDNFQTLSEKIQVQASDTINVSRLLSPISENVSSSLNSLEVVKQASLELLSEPEQAEVSIGGEYKGTTPLTIDSLPLGLYEIIIRKKQYYDEVVKVDISAEKRHQVSISLVKILSSSSAKAESEKLNSLGDKLMEEKNYQEAVKKFDLALKYRADNITAHLSLGICYLRLKIFDKSLEEFEAAKKLDESYPPTYYSFATYYSLTNNKDMALEFLTKAINLYPQYRELVVKDSDFDYLKQFNEFKKLLETTSFPN